MLGAIIGSGINLVANGIGSYYANKQKKEAEAAYKAEQNKLLSDINQDINSNYLDRADSRNALRKLTDSNTETLRQLNTGAIRGGATDEAKVAMASQLNKRTADVVGDIAAIGEQHKDSLKQQKRNLLANMALHQYQQASDTSGWQTLLSNIGNAASSIGTAFDNKQLYDLKLGEDSTTTGGGTGGGTSIGGRTNTFEDYTENTQIKNGRGYKGMM